MTTTTFRKPTGRPPWPITLIAGAEKAGKSYACAAASASELVGRTFWIGVGEDDPDEYGAIEGADFEIAQHDGTYRGILTALREASTAPTVDGKPTLLVLDSATRLWEMLSDEAQQMANRRRKNNNPDADSPISMDLWNRAADRWHNVMDVVRAHQGPTLITARLDVVTVLDEQGKPTKERMTKIKSQKTLPFDVGVIVEMPSRGETYITGARSLRLDVPMAERKSLPNFTVHDLWVRLGLAEAGATAPRQHSAADGAASAQAETKPAQPAQHTQQAQPVDAGTAALAQRRAAATDWGQALEDAKNNIDLLRDLRAKAIGMGAPAEYINRIDAAGKALAARTEGTEKVA
jgi:hypothetical protein